MNNKKNILTSAPFLADDFVEANEIVFDVEQYQKFIKDKKVHLGLFGKYLICKFHDSWILETLITDNLFSITLNDFSTHVFADALIEKKNLEIDHDKLVFPIKLDFKTKTRVTFNEVDNDGYLTVIEPVKLDEYLNEQIVSINDGNIELAFTFWKDSINDRPGERYVLLLTTSEIIVTEKMDSAWQQIIGSDFDNYYHYFKKHFNSDRYVSDQYRCLNLIEEYDANLKKISTNA